MIWVCRVLVLLCVLGGLVPLQARADIDPAEYQLKSSVRSAKDSQELQAEFEADRQKEAARRKLEEESAARHLAAEKAAWEALPHAVRLTRSRCAGCHVEGNYMNQRHNRLGWELVILRMQHLNAASLATGERSVIAAHLAQTYPATGGALLIEALQQLAAALTPVWLWLAWNTTRSRFAWNAENGVDNDERADCRW